MSIKVGANSPVVGELEQPQIMLADADFAESVMNGKFDDCLIIAVPITGKAQFKPSKDTKDGKTSKATFVVAQVGSSYGGEQLGMSSDTGDINGLPLSLSLSLTAAPPNRKATTIDEALGRKPEEKPEGDKSETETK